MIVQTSSTAVKTAVPETEAYLSLDCTQLWIGKGRRKVFYGVEEFPCDLNGRAFQLVKTEVRQGEPDRYEVFIHSGDGPDCRRQDLCSCIAHQKGGYCKHTDVLAALIADGRLPDPREEMYRLLNGERNEDSAEPLECPVCHGEAPYGCSCDVQTEAPF